MTHTVPVGWMVDYAARQGLRYEPDADERWLRAWEPYATLKVPYRYEHALQATGETGSLTVARMVMSFDYEVAGVRHSRESGTWIAIVQDVRIDAVAAATSDPGRTFSETLDLVTMPRRRTGDSAFDAVFAAFSPTPESLARAITPSLRKLVLGWRIPLHFELRKGGFVLVPVALTPDVQGLSWLVRSLELFGEKATKHRASG
ncbi:hypothetical protein LVJ94_47380 [Pendulispora rubella]|uniref:Uncharacterized protein n=1 Tax=Pendulispora rubella TaxID=2741070 RepID=A0ABZ2L726_9BACT